MITAQMHTPVGTAVLVESEGYIVEISIKDEAVDSMLPSHNSPLLNSAMKELQEYFDGKRTTFTFPVKQPGTPFQQSVWQQLMETGFGETCSYAKLSAQMNNPLAIRAIAAANGKNKLWVVVPCHRIIGSDGSLTGYAGGLWRKQWLLKHEAMLAGKAQLQLTF